MNKHKWQLVDVSMETSPFASEDLKTSKKIFCSAIRKRPPAVGRYSCPRCGSSARVFSVLKGERNKNNQKGYDYRVSLNWTEDCDEALVVNVCKA